MTASTTSIALEPFDSLAMLRKAHLHLMRDESMRKGPALSDEAVERIDDFLSRAEASGTFIDAHADRDAAQSILDYWTATLATAATTPDTPPVRPRLLAPFDRLRAPDLRDRPSPFKGLHAFSNEDAERYFGRTETVQALVEKIGEERLVIVRGPSGSGKSSLILAGLMSRLKAGALAGSYHWKYLPPIVPGNDPLAALLLAVRPEGQDPGMWVATHKPQLQKSASHILSLVEEGAGKAPVFLFVDQFEELFTLCKDEAVRERLADAVLQLADSRTALHHIVLAMREGFVSEAMQLRALARFAGRSEMQFSPSPLSPRELREVIERPADLVGLKFDEGIIDELIREVEGESTALPLLQFTLLKLWERRDRNRITWDTYRAVGRPREALTRTADATFEALKLRENQVTAERIFGDLVQPSVGAEFVRRRVRRESLHTLEAFERVDHVLQHFVNAGLLRVTPGVDADDDRFEVAHEALIRNWPLLGEWLRVKHERSGRALQFVNTSHLWRQSGRQRAYLLTGKALEDAREFTATSKELAELVEASSQAERASARRVWLMLAAAAVILLIGLGLGLMREHDLRQSAESARTEAVEARRKAEEAVEAETAARIAAEQARRDAERRAAESEATLSKFAKDSATGRPANPQAVSRAIERIVTEPISGQESFWPAGSTLGIRFLNGSEELRALVKQHAVEWTTYANINFDFDATGDAAIRISLDEPFAWSYLGIQARVVPSQRPTMTLGSIRGLDGPARRHTILHEFGHALGLVHESQQPGSDIRWDREAVIRDMAKNGWDRTTAEENVFRKYSGSIGYSRPFDPKSVMNYFNIPAEWTYGKYVVTLNPELSDGDKVLISRLYPGRWTPPATATPSLLYD